LAAIRATPVWKIHHGSPPQAERVFADSNPELPQNFVEIGRFRRAEGKRAQRVYAIGDTSLECQDKALLA
jgi:hypothetical protein